MDTVLRAGEDDGVECPKCGVEVDSRYRLKKHDSARHQQTLTDDRGRCKMCGELVEEAGDHLREECDPGT
jgi:hypothetical protein